MGIFCESHSEYDLTLLSSATGNFGRYFRSYNFFFFFISLLPTLSGTELAFEEFYSIRLETVPFDTILANRDVFGREEINGRICLKTSTVNLLSDCISVAILTISLHTVAAHAIRAAVKTNLSY